MADKKAEPAVDHAHLTVTGAHKSIPAPHFDVERDDSGVVIVVTKAFGPAGDNLVGLSGVEYEGHPAITLGVRGAGKEGQVHLSPIHGDPRKKGVQGIPFGTKCELFCPVSGKPLDKVGEIDDDSGAEYYAVYLTQECAESAMMMISNVWGHYHSRLIDDMELISYWATTQDKLE